MKLKSMATVRFISYSLGIFFQIGTILLLTTKLEIYQFGVWGVATSFVYIISTFTQLSYLQHIEKYFPNYDDFNSKLYLVKYFKTILYLFPVAFSFLFVISKYDFFTKFNIKNLNYLLIMIAFWSIIESLLALFDAYFLSKGKSQVYDKLDLLLYKAPKFLVFYLLLEYKFSVFYLIFVSILFRIFLFFLLILYEYKKLKNLKNYLKENSVFENNFRDLRYNIFAFSNDIIYQSFLNILFLMVTIYSEVIDIAHYSIVIIIINNLRPLLNSIQSVLTPFISNSLHLKFNNEKTIINIKFFNQLLISLVIFSCLLVAENELLITYFFNDYFDGINKLIFISVFSSTLRSIYFAKYINLLFSNFEKILLVFNLFNSISVISLYLFMFNVNEINFTYFYMLYEINYIIFVNVIKKDKFNVLKILSNSCWLYFFTLSVSILYIFNKLEPAYLFLFPILLFVDFKRKKIGKLIF